MQTCTDFPFGFVPWVCVPRHERRASNDGNATPAPRVAVADAIPDLTLALLGRAPSPGGFRSMDWSACEDPVPPNLYAPHADYSVLPFPLGLRWRAFEVRSMSKDARFMLRELESGSALGPWQRRHGHALRNAIGSIVTYRRMGFIVLVSSRGHVREITDKAHEKGRGDYSRAIEARDARGVWG